MGVRESLLNTITSVGNGDFVRIVTSAGASSKATVANLFKSFESGLSAKSSLTTSDYIRVVGSDNVSYKQDVNSLMQTIGIKYAEIGSFSTQSALETALNTKLNAMPTNSTASIRFSTTASFGVFSNGATYIGELRKGGSATYASISLHGLGFDAEIVGNKSSSTWIFQKEPTRAEVDALKTYTSYTHNATVGSASFQVLTKVFGDGLKIVQLSSTSSVSISTSGWATAVANYPITLTTFAIATGNGEIMVRTSGGALQINATNFSGYLLGTGVSY